MKFTVEKNVVLNAVKKVGGIVGKGVIPVLSNILFETDQERKTVKVTSTNMELRLECRFEAQISEQGKTTIPGKKLIQVLSNMQGAEVDFATDDQHHTTIKCGRAKVKLLGMGPDDFPSQDEFVAKCMLTMKMEQMQKLLKEGGYLFSTDNTRKALCGIYAELDENICHFVSTNGKALAHAECTFENKCIAKNKESAIIPVQALNTLVANAKADTVNVGFDDKKIMAWAGDLTVTSKLIEGNYPNYKNFLKDGYLHSAVLPVAETIAKLNLLNAVVAIDNPAVDLTISGSMVKLSAQSSANGAVDDEMELFEGVEGQEYTIILNPALMLQAFDAHKQEEKVTLCFDEVTTPVAFNFENSLAVIMPIRPKANNQQ